MFGRKVIKARLKLSGYKETTMKWVKNGKTQVAQGEFGKFVISKSGGLYVAKYYGDKYFTLPLNRSIKKLKEICQENYYWED